MSLDEPLTLKVKRFTRLPWFLCNLLEDMPDTIQRKMVYILYKHHQAFADWTNERMYMTFAQLITLKEIDNQMFQFWINTVAFCSERGI